MTTAIDEMEMIEAPTQPATSVREEYRPLSSDGPASDQHAAASVWLRAGRRVVSVLLAFTAAALFSLGTWLLLQRRLTRIVIGIGLIGHGTNILLITSGGGGGIPPVIGKGDKEDFADPLPQALALTAIVITFGVTAFLLAMAYRSWQLTHDDVVADDLEDRLIAAQSAHRQRCRRRGGGRAGPHRPTRRATRRSREQRARPAADRDPAPGRMR